MSYKIEKPYTLKQRLDFIIEHNHKNELKIEETDSALFALEENEIIENGEVIINPNYETTKRQKENEILEYTIKQELKNLDKKRIRAVCENGIKDSSTGQTWLQYYNEQASILRNKLQNIK